MEAHKKALLPSCKLSSHKKGIWTAAILPSSAHNEEALQCPPRTKLSTLVLYADSIHYSIHFYTIQRDAGPNSFSFPFFLTANAKIIIKIIVK